jgi:bifunctional UDP-N-acetylglucosamine pyrophosphorylase/glucosamine-1-phosphate N-acetyltransferase
VEYKDASDDEKKINFCNSGIMCFDGEKLFSILSSISNENAAQEYYLTDAVEIALRMGLKCTAVECPVDEASAANTLEELALLEDLIKKRKSQK